MNFLAKIIRKNLSDNKNSKKYKQKIWRRVASTALCTTVLSTTIGGGITTSATTTATDFNKVVDKPTDAQYIDLMANSDYPGSTTSRYAGRIWADKSVFSNKVSFSDGVGYEFSVDNPDELLISGSFLGSTRSVITNQPTPLDVMVILDKSSSMAVTSKEKNEKMERAVRALNTLFNSIKGHNTESRMGLVAYSNEAEIILPLDKYTWEGNLLTCDENRFDSDDGQNTPNMVKVHVSNTLKAENSTNIKQSFITSKGTYTQKGFYTGMNELANEKTTEFTSEGNTIKRKPVVIMITDGQPLKLSSGDWWEDPKDLDPGTHNGNNSGKAACALATVMTASYWKKKIENNYKTDPLVYTIGVDVKTDNGIEDPYVKATMDPKNGFIKYRGIDGIVENDIRNVTIPDVDQKLVGYAFNAWEEYKNKKSFYLPLNSKSEKVKFNHPADFDLENDEDIYYVDKYYPADSNDLESIFNSIMTDIGNNAFHAIEDTTGGEQSAMTYTDEIGEYMEVKKVNAVLWSGTLYNVTEDKNGQYSLALASGHKAPVHPITNKEIDTKDITIKLETDLSGKQEFKVEIKKEFLPLRHDEITTTQDYTDMVEYETSRFQTTPLRVIYTVGLKDEIKTDGKVDFSKIDKNYITSNTDENGNVNFYSNAWESGEEGSTTVKFSPSKSNRYYYFQKNRQIFKINNVQSQQGKVI